MKTGPRSLTSLSGDGSRTALPNGTTVRSSLAYSTKNTRLILDCR
jgi:hypothetical protein